MILSDHVQVYLDDRASLREHVAALAGLHPDDAKRLVSSLFNGAQLPSSPYCSAFQLLGYDQAKMQALQQDQRIRLLRLNIKTIWQTIERAMNTSLRKSKAKWSQYFKVEHRILLAVKAEPAELGAKLFTEHDGFWPDRELDLNRVIARIRSGTGFAMKQKVANAR